MDSKKFIEILREAAQTHEMTVRRYSGRAMYGKHCVAVTTEKEYSAIAAITAEIAWTDDDDLMRDWVEILSDTRVDSMGRYDVVIYWPEVEWTDELDELQVHEGDYVRKDGDWVRVERVRGDEVFTSDGGVMGLDELSADDIRLESEQE